MAIRTKPQLSIALVALVAALVCAQPAAAALSPAVPEGLPTNNASKAGQVVMDRADEDPSYGSTLAKNSGANAYNPADYKPVGYSNGAPAGTVNSGVADSGSVQKAQDTKHCNKKSKMLVMLNVRTERKLYICTGCANPRIYSARPAPFRSFSKGTTVNYRKTATQDFKLPCQNTGQPVVVTVTTTVKGKLKGRVWGKLSGTIKARLKASFNGKITNLVKIKCGEVPPGTAIPLSCKAGENLVGGNCVSQAITQDCKAGEIRDNSNQCVAVTNNCGVVVIGNNNTVNSDNCNAEFCVAHGGNWNSQTQVCTFSSPPPPPPPPPPPSPQSVVITAMTTLNDIPEGLSSGPFNIDVNASDPGGSLTVDPGVGSISSCDGGVRQGSMTLSLARGAQQVCVILWAPAEASINSMTVTATAVLGTSKDIKSQTFAITHPVRP